MQEAQEFPYPAARTATGHAAHRIDTSQEAARARYLDAQAADFTGPKWELMMSEATSLAVGTIHAAIKAGNIDDLIAAALPQRTLRSFGPTLRERPSYARQMVQDAVHSAAERFRDRILLPGRFDPDGPATIYTFFVIRSVQRLAGALDRPNRSHRARKEAEEVLLSPAAFDMMASPTADATFHGEDGVHVALRVLRMAMDRSHNPEQLRTMVLLRALGWEHAAIAEQLSLTEAAVSQRFSRLHHLCAELASGLQSSEGEIAFGEDFGILDQL